MYEPVGLALEIFKKRYTLHLNETWAEACIRVANHVAEAEIGENVVKYRSEFLDILQQNLFSPGGRIWYGSGRPRGQLLNCFVVGSVEDSREGWGRTVSDMIVIAGTGGGAGFNFSPIRPRGSVIAGTGGQATGAVSLMEIINSAGEVIKAGGGRRTALMFALNLDHGDLPEFLDKKLDLKQLNNANVSVWLNENPEEFFRKVKKDEQLDLKFRGKTVKSVSAKQLWQKIIQNSLKTGEPGILNGYLANKMWNGAYWKPVESTNPCLPASATLLTPERIYTMGECKVGDTIWSGKQWTKVVKKEMTGVKPVYAYKTTAGTFRGTENHRVVSKGKKIEVCQAPSIDIAPCPFLCSCPESLFPQDIMDGLVVGDGTTKNGTNKNLLYIGKNDEELLSSEISHLIRNPYSESQETWEISTKIKAPIPKTYERKVPDEFFFGSMVKMRGFLRGLYSANGSVVGKVPGGWRITLKASSFSIVESVQQMLSALGISSYYTTNKAHLVEFKNGEYECKESYDLNIGAMESKRRFKDLIGFIHSYKTEKVDEFLGKTGKSDKPLKTSFDIFERAYLGEEPVYSITVEAEEHTYWTGGLLVANCGELPMVRNGACCLGSLVLPRFIKGEGRETDIDWDLLKATITTSVRFLDDVLSVNNYPLPEIADTCSQIRQIGLGLMGLHDTLLMMGLRYNSDSGLEFVDKLMGFIKNSAYNTSIDLGVEKGAFPAFNADAYLKGTFIKTLKPSIRTRIKEHGIRNCSLLTIAPTGTTSMMCEVTSGIEPMFAPAYLRRYRDGDALKEEIVVHPLLKQFVNEKRGIKHFQGSYELSLRDHLEMQRVCQKHIDNAVSKCLAEGTLIPTNQGLVPIEGFSEIKKDDSYEKIEGFETNGKKILSHYKMGSGEAVSVHVESSFDLVGAKETHRVKTSEGWKLMRDLGVGDRILGERVVSHGEGGAEICFADTFLSNSAKISTPKKMSPDLAKWLGMVASDGCSVESIGYVGICWKDKPEVKETFVKLCESIFGVSPKINIDKRNGVESAFLTSRNLVRYVQSLIGKGARSKSVPKQILRGNAKEKLAFISGLTLDGYYKPTHGLCIYEGLSQKLAYQASEICRSFGLPTVHCGAKWVPLSKTYAYQVVVSNELQSKIRAIENHKNREIVNVAYPVFLDRSLLVPSVKSSNPHYRALRALRDDKGRDYCSNKLAEDMGWPINILVFIVTSVKDAGKVEMYDIEVEDSHQYVVNGMISHNTLNLTKNTSEEELSDIIMEFLPELKGLTVYPDGSREDQPLTPMSLEEALKYIKEGKEAKIEATSKDSCKSGACDV
jgi:ribonucleotide reductase alpha subunit